MENKNMTRFNLGVSETLLDEVMTVSSALNLSATAWIKQMLKIGLLISSGKLKLIDSTTGNQVEII